MVPVVTVYVFIRFYQSSGVGVSCKNRVILIPNALCISYQYVIVFFQSLLNWSGLVLYYVYQCSKYVDFW